MAEQQTSAVTTADAGVPPRPAAPATSNSALNVEPLPEDGNIVAEVRAPHLIIAMELIYPFRSQTTSLLSAASRKAHRPISGQASSPE